MSEDLQRLARIVKERREKLNLSQMDVWKKRGGPSSTKMGQIEDAQEPAPSESTRKKLERALEWAPGSVASILAGGSPLDRSTAEQHEHRHGSFDEMMREVDSALERFRAAISELVAAEAHFDGVMRAWARTELFRQRLEELIANNPRYATGFAATPEEADEVLASIPRATPAETAELVASSALDDDREWTRQEMALIEVFWPDYPQDVRKGSSYADIEPFRERARRLRVARPDTAGAQLSAAPGTTEDLPAAAAVEDLEEPGEF